ncbi:pyridoxamine 5'-phosphate oxidase family protein [Candidatus Nitrosotalea okcheonensis]|uniref:Putative Pyridoxamine 5'-phosphate oxidase n=1 Tax=Candidatus Nitrosotalea okcheonensis TaxID=1903276 RepID=A0A2H1FDW0_9ARCH|nr:pyridoxamine 5'-phosphate oxidase family protein [Candidatus Nitrosotalea okcheonensis]SMH70962.1 putative Pyridoxamine 5'-phosphate oxidase [Candidatus Nitrosotalea okcheonensis]
MQLLGRLEIRSKEKIIEFLNHQETGRICSIDKDGFPQIIPMNFAYTNDVIYMHSHPRGEKLENIVKNSKVGFEVDRSLEFLPSYFTSPTDASQADTLYISIVIKGKASLVSDPKEKTLALNELMKKYQPEGGYEKLTPDMKVVEEVAIIKVVPITMRGKYKIGQHWDKKTRLEIAKKILARNSPTAHDTIKTMGIINTKDGLQISEEPSW